MKKDKERVTMNYTCKWPGCGHTFDREFRLKQEVWGPRIHPMEKVKCPQCGRGVRKEEHNE